MYIFLIRIVERAIVPKRSGRCDAGLGPWCALQGAQVRAGQFGKGARGRYNGRFPAFPRCVL
jgi:hypothetical protein